MRPRLFALHVVAAGLVAALWLSGGGAMLLAADRFHALPVLGAVLLIGILFAWFRRWPDVEWIADLLPILGLIGTVTGFVLVAMTGDWGSAVGKTAIAKHVLLALVSNLGGIVGYAWLTLARRVCAIAGRDDVPTC